MDICLTNELLITLAGNIDNSWRIEMDERKKMAAGLLHGAHPALTQVDSVVTLIHLRHLLATV